jgi:DNA-binding beta-propeller fold protein YncE
MQSGPGQLSTPQGIAVVPSSGDVLVADNMNNRIQEFKPSGKFVRAFGSQGSNPGQFNGPMGLGLGPKGEIYVADSSNGRVEEFSSSREYVRSFGTFTNSPNALAVAPNGDVFVADGPFIRHFTGTGAALSSFGGSGVGKGRFNTTIGGLAVSPSGYLFATDYSGGRVEEFTANGKYMRSLANSGKAAVLGGIGIAVSRTSIFVSDNGHQRAIQLHLDGSFLRAFATKNPGKLVYPGPAGTDCAGLAYIADLDVGRVREYGRASASHPGCR